MNASFPDATQRAIALGFILTFSNFGGMISGQIYRESDAPRYILGHAVTAAMATIGATLSLINRYLMKKLNEKALKNVADMEDIDQTAFLYTL